MTPLYRRFDLDTKSKRMPDFTDDIDDAIDQRVTALFRGLAEKQHTIWESRGDCNGIPLSILVAPADEQAIDGDILRLMDSEAVNFPYNPAGTYRPFHATREIGVLFLCEPDMTITGSLPRTKNAREMFAGRLQQARTAWRRQQNYSVWTSDGAVAGFPNSMLLGLGKVTERTLYLDPFLATITDAGLLEFHYIRLYLPAVLRNTA